MKKIVIVILCFVLGLAIASCKSEMDLINDQIEEANKETDKMRENPFAYFGEWSYTDEHKEFLESLDQMVDDPVIIFYEDGTVVFFDNGKELEGTYTHTEDTATLTGEKIGDFTLEKTVGDDLKYYLIMDGSITFVAKE